jgi:hypothetical protein
MTVDTNNPFEVESAVQSGVKVLPNAVSELRLDIDYAKYLLKDLRFVAQLSSYSPGVKISREILNFEQFVQDLDFMKEAS